MHEKAINHFGRRAKDWSTLSAAVEGRSSTGFFVQLSDSPQLSGSGAKVATRSNSSSFPDMDMVSKNFRL